MPIMKGKIAKMGTKTLETKKGPMDKFWVLIQNDDRLFSGFGDIPEGWKEGIAVEFEYEKQEVEGIETDDDTGESRPIKRTYYNIRTPNKTEKQITKAIEPIKADLSEIKRVLTIPKIHVGISEKVPTTQYGNKEYSINLTINPDEINPNLIKGLMNMANTIIQERKKEDGLDKAG